MFESFVVVVCVWVGVRWGVWIIGVMGLVGKIGVKEVIFVVLDCLSYGVGGFGVYCLVKSYNNYVGVLFSFVWMLVCSCFGVFEMGMNYVGEIDVLVC